MRRYILFLFLLTALPAVGMVLPSYPGFGSFISEGGVEWEAAGSGPVELLLSASIEIPWSLYPAASIPALQLSGEAEGRLYPLPFLKGLFLSLPLDLSYVLSCVLNSGEPVAIDHLAVASAGLHGGYTWEPDEGVYLELYGGGAMLLFSVLNSFHGWKIYPQVQAGLRLRWRLK